MSEGEIFTLQSCNSVLEFKFRKKYRSEGEEFQEKKISIKRDILL